MLKNLIHHHLFAKLIFSLSAGLLMSFAMFNHFLRLTGLSNRILLVLLPLLFLSLSLLVWVVHNSLTTWMKANSRSSIRLWVALCLAGAASIVDAIPLPPQIPTTARSLEIISPAATDSAIWLIEVKDNRDEKIPFHLLEIHGDWSEEDGMLVSRDSEESSLHYAFSTRGGRGEYLSLLFEAHPGSPPVTIRLDGREVTEVLDEGNLSEREIKLPLRPNPLYAILIYGSEILALAFACLLFAVFSRHQLEKYSDVTLQVFILLDAALMAAVICTAPHVSASISNADVQAYFQRHVWLPLLFWNSTLTAVVYRMRSYLSPQAMLLPFLAAMVICYGLLADWNSFLVAPDSYGYVNNPKLRPPVYPMVVNLATAGTDFDRNVEQFEKHTPITDSDEPLQRVSRLQKIFLFATSMVLVWAMCFAFGFWTAPLQALFMLWLYIWHFFPLEVNYILVESMAQGWLFLLLAAMLAFFRSGKAVFIPLAASLVSLVYLTRSASVYTGILLLAIVLWALLKDWRRYWKVIAGSAVLSISLVMLPALLMSAQTGKFTLSPQYASATVTLAIEVAQPEDVDLMPDELSKEFLALALEEREIQNAQIAVEYADSDEQQYFHRMASNVWNVAYPVAGGLTGSTQDAEALIFKVSSILLQEHRREFIEIGLYALQVSTGYVNRLVLHFPPLGFWPIFLIAVGLCLLLRGWQGLAAGACLLAHLAHTLIQCFFNMPETRHIYASEFLVPLAYSFLLWGIIQFFIEKKHPLSRTE